MDLENTTNVEEIVTGIIVDCSKLNIRKNPSLSAEIVTRLDKSTEVMIDMKTSTYSWYSICTASGIEGFCLKEYVKIM